MRVALVVERFEPAGGGVEQVVWNVARGLAKAGDEVHVIARHGEPCSGVRLHPIPVPTLWQPLRLLAFSARAGREGRRGAFDVVHSFARTRRQHLVSAGGGSHADMMRHTYGARAGRARRLSPRHAVQLAMERRIFADPDQIVVCVSGMVRDEIARRFGVAEERLVVIHNAVDTARFDPNRQRTAARSLRAELGPEKGTVWLFAGSGWRRKGLDTALEALARSHGDARLWVAGSDAPAPWRRRAERLGVAARVRFLGARGDLERVYAAADGLLLPTRYDAFGLVCLEAAASARPVVTSALAGAAELLTDAAVVVADPRDAGGFADALDRLADPALREKLGAEGRRVAERCTWSHHIAALRDVYRRIAR